MTLKSMLAAVLVGAAASCSTARGALVAHFDFEEGSGNTTADKSGSGFIGTLNGNPQWVTTGLANVPSGTTAALSFDGAGDFVLTDFQGIGGSGARTIAAWIKTSTITNATIAGWGDSATDCAKWHFRVNDSTTNGTLGGLRTEIQGSYEIGDVSITNGQWRHVASVYSGGGTFGSGQVSHYVNGVLVGVGGDGADTVTVNTTLSATISNNSAPVLLGGRRQGTSTSSLTGLLDDVRIYDTALTPGEIQALAIPEPATGALLAGVSGLLLLGRRRPMTRQD